MKKWVIGLACVAMGVATAMGQVATLPTTWSGAWTNANLPVGWTNFGLGSDYAGTGGMGYDGAGGGAAKFDNTGDMLTIHFDSSPGEISYWIVRNGTATSNLTFAVEESDDGTSYSAVASYAYGDLPTSAASGGRTNALTASSRYARFNYVLKPSGCNVGIDGVAITAGSGVITTNVKFTASAAAVDETPGTYVVTVIKTVASGDVSGTVVLSGTATEGAGADYTVDTTNFTMSGATTSATFTVTINDDADVESAETVVLTLADVVGGTIATPSVFTLTINANDIPSHAITIVTNAPENGTVTTTPAGTAAEGQTVTITATPAGGYRVASIAVVDGAMNPVTVTGNTFVMPTSDATVTVAFEVYVAPDVLIDFEDYGGSYALTNYAAGGVTWAMTNAYSGNTVDDAKNGAKAARFENNRGGTGNPAKMTGTAFAQPITKINFWYANYGVNDGGAFKVQVSSDGSSWTDVGATEYNPSSKTLVEGVIDTIPANMTYAQFITTTGTAQRVNIDDVGFYFGAATFGVTVNRTNGFVVAEGASDTITATAANGGAPYSYSWTSTLGEGYRTADSNLFAILATAPTGSYSATVMATDTNLVTVSNTVTFRVAAPAPKYPIAITTNSPANGTVTTTPAGEAEAGQTVTITATPASGYTVGAITATESGGGTELPIVNKTFVMTNAGVVVAVTFKEAATSGALIISQYYEGTSNNKWIEIYNPGSTTIDLQAGGYRLGTWNNVAAREAWKTNGTPTLAVVLSNSIAAGATYLVGHGSATNPVYAVANQTAGFAFNGDDSIVLYTGATYDFANVVDAIGMTASNGIDRSFVRKSSVTVGVNTDFNAADWDEYTLTNVEEAAESTNVRLGYHSTGAPVFSVALDRANGFTVAQGASAAITATATNGTPGYTYSWTSSLGPSYYTTNANVFTISASAPLGTYTSTVTATDSTLATAEKSVYFSVTGAPPSGAWISVVGSRSGTLGVQMDLTITLSNSVTPAANWYIDLKDPDLADDFSYAFDDVTGAFSLVPAKTGNYSLTATATDSGDALLAATNVTLTVGADTVWTIGSGTGAAMFTTLTNIIIVLPTNYTLSAVLGGGASAAGLNGLGQGLGTLAPGVDYTWTPSNRTVNVFNTVTNRRFVRIRATTP